MGSRADDKLKEIDELRAGLSAKLGELEEKFPFAGFGKKAALALVGSSVSAPVLAFGLRRLRGGSKKRAKARDVAAQPVVVNVFPKSLTLLAAVGIAAWAGTKVYDAYLKTKKSTDGSFRPAVVTQMPEAGRHTGAGT